MVKRYKETAYHKKKHKKKGKRLHRRLVNKMKSDVPLKTQRAIQNAGKRAQRVVDNLQNIL